MLRDSEIAKLRIDEEYRRLTKTGLKYLAVDLISSNKGDFKPDISLLVKAVYKLAKARVIRRELVTTSRDFLERLINCELRWPRIPDSVKVICESEKESFMWMRYDVPRVEALFSRSRALLTDAEFRNILKSYSSLEGDKNLRLQEITNELALLLKLTIRSINSRGIYDKLIGLRAEEFYEQNEKQIQSQFLAASRGGTLGLIPSNPEMIEGDNDQR